jgi:hypothetical protein
MKHYVELTRFPELPGLEAGPWEDFEELSSTENVRGEVAKSRTQARLLSMLRTQTR